MEDFAPQFETTKHKHFTLYYRNKELFSVR